MVEVAPKKPKVMIYFDSFGTGGPVSVANRISKAFQDKGCEVVLLANAQSFDDAVQFEGRPTIEKIPGEMTSASMRRVLRNHMPDVLITEHYPFMHDPERVVDEFVQYAKVLKPEMKIYSVARDIPVIKKPDEIAQRCAPYDAILVRGDHKVMPFQQFMPPEQYQAIRDKVFHVGYMVPTPPAASPKTSGEVVISLGGTHSEYDQVAIQGLLAHLPHLRDDLQGKQWCVVLGKGITPSQHAALEAEVVKLPERLRAHVHLEEAQPDLHARLGKAEMVITRGGITAVEALSQNRPTLMITRSAEGDAEQVIRAEALKAKMPRAQLVRQPMRDAAGERIAHWDNNLSQQVGEALEKLSAQSRVASKPDILMDGHTRIAQAIIDRCNGTETSFEGRSKA